MWIFQCNILDVIFSKMKVGPFLLFPKWNLLFFISWIFFQGKFDFRKRQPRRYIRLIFGEIKPPSRAVGTRTPCIRVVTYSHVRRNPNHVTWSRQCSHYFATLRDSPLRECLGSRQRNQLRQRDIYAGRSAPGTPSGKLAERRTWRATWCRIVEDKLWTVRGYISTLSSGSDHASRLFLYRNYHQRGET